MNRTILIAGKDFPDGKDLATTAVLHGRTAFITASAGGQVSDFGDGSFSVGWNRGSALSARTLLISASNNNGHLDEGVLIFDENHFAPLYGSPGPAESTKACNELVLGYQYLAAELLLRFNQRKIAGLEKNPGKIVFVYKPGTNEAEAVKNPNLRLENPVLSKTLVASASAAFRAFAENFAASVCGAEEVIPVLVECSPTNELSKKDSAFMAWLCDYMEEIDSLKKPLSDKQKVTWIKAGARVPGGFGFFRTSSKN